MAKKSEAEAERAAERAIGSARRADEAGRLARVDVKRARAELAEAEAQAEA